MAKIIAIDDEVGFTSTIEQYFSPRGYEVLVASRADEGMDLIKRESPDAILMDLKMPGLDGDKALRQILQDKPDAKVIMITAFQDEGKMRSRLMGLGAYAYFEKPIPSMRELERVIKEAVNKGK